LLLLGLIVLFLSACVPIKKQIFVNRGFDFDDIESVTVLPFSVPGDINGDLAADKFATQLLHLNACRVVERTKMATIFEEQKLSLAGLVEAERFDEVSKLLNVDAYFFGSVNFSRQARRPDLAVSLNIRLVDVRSGDIVWNGDYLQSERVSSIDVALDDIARRFRRDISAELRGQR
jgi:curli biogenesis system outer membrane secretion channel CsgG